MEKIKGIVIEGKKEGRKLGYPTANIPIKKIIEDGVYKGDVLFNGKNYLAAIFVPKGQTLLEVHLLNFEGDLYGKEIEVKIESKIRDTALFLNDTQMKELIKSDIASIKKPITNT